MKVTKADENNVHTKEGLIEELVNIHHAAWVATLGEHTSEESYFVLNCLENLIEELKNDR